MALMQIRLPRTSPLLFDGILAAALLAVWVISLAEAGPGPSEEFTRAPDVWNVILVIFMTTPVVLRRRLPTAVLAIVSLAWIVERMAG